MQIKMNQLWYCCFIYETKGANPESDSSNHFDTHGWKDYGARFGPQIGITLDFYIQWIIKKLKFFPTHIKKMKWIIKKLSWSPFYNNLGQSKHLLDGLLRECFVFVHQCDFFFQHEVMAGSAFSDWVIWVSILKTPGYFFDFWIVRSQTRELMS